MRKNILLSVCLGDDMSICQGCCHKKHCNKAPEDCRYFRHIDNRLRDRIYSDLSEIYNNLMDDLEMDTKGEQGYKNEKEVVKAIKKYTLKVIEKKIKKWEP